jgi:hypothetical protein
VNEIYTAKFNRPSNTNAVLKDQYSFFPVGSGYAVGIVLKLGTNGVLNVTANGKSIA